ncbi:hypothetical protein HPB49_001458 [Dermacentor silvarum]|uniref:Uncharacterized protein n=1 Tax=Dermacentor silvarum TaxID=543639 RepID=A0ACB8DA50_DERSI|nr:hypothetical protein HPB49_001458 [Dermacentor silvarum]
MGSELERHSSPEMATVGSRSRAEAVVQTDLSMDRMKAAPGRLRAFRKDRSSVVQVGRATSWPRSVTCSVPQGSVLSPFLFNLALAPISECVLSSGNLLVRAAVYADDVALFVRGPPATMAQMRLQIQAAANAVGDFLRAIGLRLSAAKSEAIMVHPRTAARRHTACVVVRRCPPSLAADGALPRAHHGPSPDMAPRRETASRCHTPS